MSLVLVTAFSLGLLSKNADAEMWKVPVVFTDGKAEGVVYIGASTDTTDGFDILEEMEAKSDPAAVFDAYISHPEWNRSAVNYMSDIRSLSTPQSWTISVGSSSVGQTLDVNWDLSNAAQYLLCNGLDLTLTDDTDASTDMESSASASYYNFSDAARDFTVSLAADGAGYATLAAPEVDIRFRRIVLLRWPSVEGSVDYVVLRRIDGGAQEDVSGKGQLRVKRNGNAAFLDRESRRIKDATIVYTIYAVDTNNCESEHATITIKR